MPTMISVKRWRGNDDFAEKLAMMAIMPTMISMKKVAMMATVRAGTFHPGS